MALEHFGSAESLVFAGIVAEIALVADSPGSHESVESVDLDPGCAPLRSSGFDDLAVRFLELPPTLGAVVLSNPALGIGLVLAELVDTADLSAEPLEMAVEIPDLPAHAEILVLGVSEHLATVAAGESFAVGDTPVEQCHQADLSLEVLDQSVPVGSLEFDDDSRHSLLECSELHTALAAVADPLASGDAFVLRLQAIHE